MCRHRRLGSNLFKFLFSKVFLRKLRFLIPLNLKWPKKKFPKSSFEPKKKFPKSSRQLPRRNLFRNLFCQNFRFKGTFWASKRNQTLPTKKPPCGGSQVSRWPLSGVMDQGQTYPVLQLVIPHLAHLKPLGHECIPKTIPVEGGDPLVLCPEVVGRHQV